MKYNHKQIEKKWQKKWEEEGIYRAKFPSKKSKYYVLIEFPYPSGERLHVGHARSYSAMDAIARKRRMQGCNVLYPIGWDAFGLPAENYAIKTGIHPSMTTAKNIKNAKAQVKSWGISFDWDREINTTDPKYYKWTQWIFLQLFKKGLAYRDEIPVNWCPNCKTNLANEEVVKKLESQNSKRKTTTQKLKANKERKQELEMVSVCERCGAEVEKRMQKQWMLRITDYAERLLDDLEKVNYREDIKRQQVNWIGKSKGAQIQFAIRGSQFAVNTFTTRLDTIFGVTALVVAPDKMINDKRLALEIASKEQYQKVKDYIKSVQKKSELERTELKEKTGVFTGAYAINPANNEKIPIWTADYVLGWYGEGAVMLVPAHDKRDFEFAGKYGIDAKTVVMPDVRKTRKTQPVSKSADQKISTSGNQITRNTNSAVPSYSELSEGIFIDDGVLVESGKHTGLASEEARKKILKDGKRAGWAQAKTTYKLRDWVFSRQHYWGEPIPMIFCQQCADKKISWIDISRDGKLSDKHKTEYIKYIDNKANRNGNESSESSRDGKNINYWNNWDSAGWFPVADGELPVKLPFIKRYEPADTGESPLSTMSNWVKVKCPNCGGNARRETDTMPNWAGSSWYYLAYPLADKLGSKEQKANIFLQYKKELEYWLPVDWYNGGIEHTTLHLLYSRFWHKFLFDLGVVPTEEPYAKRTSHGVVLGPDGAKMSKSKGNVINPDAIVEKFGADAFRVYEMFIGPFDEMVVWNDSALAGVRRFLERVWRLYKNSRWEVRGGKWETEARKDQDITLPESRTSHFTLRTSKSLKRKLHYTIKKVSEDMEELKFNTAIASMMEYVNEAYKMPNAKCQMPNADAEIFLRLLAPFAPHLAEELWQCLRSGKWEVRSENSEAGSWIDDKEIKKSRDQKITHQKSNIHTSHFSPQDRFEFKSIHKQPWPEYDPALVEEEMVEFVVQVNGKVRSKFKVKSSKCKVKEEIEKLAKENGNVSKFLEGKEIKKTIFIAGKLVNFVTN